MTLAEAVAEATTRAAAEGETIVVWQHVGGRLPSGKAVASRGTHITRRQAQPDPRHCMWKKIQEVEP